LQQLGLVSQIKPGLGICQLGHLSSFYKCALEKKKHYWCGSRDKKNGTEIF